MQVKKWLLLLMTLPMIGVAAPSSDANYFGGFVGTIPWLGITLGSHF